jgi:hypothetical protein
MANKPKQPTAPLFSPVMRANVEARKEGQFARSKSWGGRQDNRTARREGKNQLRKGNYES